MKRRTRILRAAAQIALLLGAAGAAGSLLASCSSHGNQAVNTASGADLPPVAARVDRLDGTVGVDRPADAADPATAGASGNLAQASVNAPVSVGSRVYVKDGSRAAIAFSGRNYARLNSRASLDVLSLSQRRTQLALREGSGVFDVGALAPEELFEVATPSGAIDFTQPGLYEVTIDDAGHASCSVLSGEAQVVGAAGAAQCSRGQLLTFSGDSAEDAYVSPIDPGVCGQIVDDYYSYRYPGTYDGRYRDYKRYQDDPYFDDPYRRSISYHYVPDNADVAGLEDLDNNGDWQDVPGQGHCWHPHVAADWAPYRDGYWDNDQPLGLTWVSNERWGWAPYHYGRWAHVGGNWYWAPGEEVTSHPVYAPALVAFIPFPHEDRVGWVPLGPGDPYVPRYYDRDYRPQYIGSTTYIEKNINVTNVVNYNVPGAVTVVRTTEFTRVITPRTALAADPGSLAGVRPTMDPYQVPQMRDLAPRTRADRATVQTPIEVQQAFSRPVITSQRPVAPAAVMSAVQALNVQPVAAEQSKRKLRLNNTGQTVTAMQPNGVPIPPAIARGGAPGGPPQNPAQPQQNPNQGGQNQAQINEQRQARIAELSQQAAQGNRAAKKEMRQLEQQQAVDDKAARQAARQQAAQQQQQQAQQQQSQAAQQAEQRKAEKQAARQQAQQAAQQQQQQAQQQAEQRKAEKQAARQQAQQAAQQQQPQAAQQAGQRRAEKQAARQQAQQAAQQQQQQAAQQAQQRKAEKEAARQQAQQAAQQQQQQAAQQAQQRKAEKQAAQQQQQQQAAQQAQQRKAEKQAARQQAQRQAAQQQQQQQDRAQRKAARQEQQKAQQAAPAEKSKAEKKAERAKNKNGEGNQ